MRKRGKKIVVHGSEFDSLSIEVESKPIDLGGGGEWVWVWGHGRYPSGSVLAGQLRNARLECYDPDEYGGSLAAAVAAAKKDFPAAEDGGGTAAMNKLMPATVPVNAPADFDEMDAGERWSDPDGDVLF